MGQAPIKVLDREEGINAIIKLQGMVGTDESRAQAERGWDSMSDREKESTSGAYAMCFPNGGAAA